MAPGSPLQTSWQFMHIPLLSCCQRFRFSSPPFHSTIEKVLMESGVSPVKRWGLFNCPQTSLYLLCKNYYGVTIFKAYFSIHKKKKTFIFSQMDGVSLLSLNPVFASPRPPPHSSPHQLLDTLVLFPAQVPSFVLGIFLM